MTLMIPPNMNVRRQIERAEREAWRFGCVAGFVAGVVVSSLAWWLI